MQTNNERVPYRFNGMNWEIRKDFLRECMSGGDHELREVVYGAMEFADGRGKFVNLDKILELVTSTIGRSASRDLRTALIGEPEDLPLIAAAGNGLAAEMAKYRLENGLSSVPPRFGRAQVIQDDGRVYPRRSASKPGQTP